MNALGPSMTMTLGNSEVDSVGEWYFATQVSPSLRFSGSGSLTNDI